MKKLLSILICIAVVLAFAACGGESGAGGSDTAGGGASAGGKDTAATGEAAKTAAKADGTIEDLVAQYTGLETDELTWEFKENEKKLIISGEGPMRDYSETAPPWDDFYNEIEHIVICDEVTSVGAAAFMVFDNLVDVSLGEAVEFIGDSAFYYCHELRTVNFPENLKYVGPYAFCNTLLHTENGFILPEGLLYVGDSAFFSAFKESFVSIPASLEYIGVDAFANTYVEAFVVSEDNKAYASYEDALYDKNITELIYYPPLKESTALELPESLIKIDRNAIQVNNTLERITIPAGVEAIEQGALYWDYAMKYVYVDENNKNYISDNGVLYTKDYKVLLYYPQMLEYTEYTVKEGTEEIGDLSMGHVDNLEAIHIPEGVTRIGDSAFCGCNNLVTLGIPESLKVIEQNATCFCDALERVDYAGSAEEWQSIEIAEYGNSALVWEYSSTQIFPAK